MSIILNEQRERRKCFKIHPKKSKFLTFSEKLNSYVSELLSNRTLQRDF